MGNARKKKCLTGGAPLVRESVSHTSSIEAMMQAMLAHLNINLRIVTLWYGGHEENDNNDNDKEDNNN